MRFTVVGAGAIGGIVGAHLLDAGHEVAFVDRNPEHVEAIRAHGLVVSGAAQLRVHPAVYSASDLPDRLDHVLLAVKSRDTEEALGLVARRLSDDGYVVSLQNGLEEYKIARAVGRPRTVGAFLTFGGHYLKPGEIVYGGRGSFRVGELDGTITPRVQHLAEVLSVFHPVEPTDNIFGYLWGKEALGAFYFATSLVDADVPAIIDKLRYRELFCRLVGEVVTVARAEGVRCEVIDGFDPGTILDHVSGPALTEPSWEAQKRYWAGHVQGEGRTGIWRDLAIHHRPTEADHLLAPIVARGRAAGVAVPRLETLLDLVHQVERGDRSLGWENLDALLGVSESVGSRS